MSPPPGKCAECGASGEALTITLVDGRRWCCDCGKYVDLVPEDEPAAKETGEDGRTWRFREFL